MSWMGIFCGESRNSSNPVERGDEGRNPAIKTTNYTKYKNEVGCRDGTVPKTVDTRRHYEE